MFSGSGGSDGDEIVRVAYDDRSGARAMMQYSAGRSERTESSVEGELVGVIRSCPFVTPLILGKVIEVCRSRRVSIDRGSV